jgi:hypothetical protein
MGSVNASVNGSVTISGELQRALTEPRSDNPSAGAPRSPDMPCGGPGALPPVPPDCPPELLAKVVRRWPKRHHELGPCLVWTGPRGHDAQRGPYGRLYDAAIGRTDYTHRVVWRRCYGPIPRGQDVDHLCGVALCQRPDHLELVTKPENTRRRHQRGP